MSSELVIAYYDASPDTTRQERWQALLTPLLGTFRMVGLLDAKPAEQAQIALVWSPPTGRLAQLSALKLIISEAGGRPSDARA